MVEHGPDGHHACDGERLRRHLASLAAGCDVTVATSEPLALDLRALGADPAVVPHGVDVARFAAGGPEPDDLAGLERPLAGFVGLIDDYVDVAALLATADALARTATVMGAPVDTDGVRHWKTGAALGGAPLADAILFAMMTATVPN